MASPRPYAAVVSEQFQDNLKYTIILWQVTVTLLTGWVWRFTQEDYCDLSFFRFLVFYRNDDAIIYSVFK
jgi:hypothetical protein